MDYATQLDESGYPVLTGYASVYPHGKIPWAHKDRHLWPTIGKTVAQRMQNYIKLCKRDGKDLTQTTTPGRYVVEWEEPKEHTRWVDNGKGRGTHYTNKSRRRRTWRYEPGTITLTNCTSRATFVQTEADETEQLVAVTAQAREFWAMVTRVVNASTYIEIEGGTP